MTRFDEFCNLILEEYSGQPSLTGPHKGKIIASATGMDGSGKTTVTYTDGSSATLDSPRPLRNNNPGNLEYGEFAKKMGAVGSDGRYAVFPTMEAGESAKVGLLKTSTYQNLSIKDAFNRYAPPNENPNYIRDLQSLTGFDLNRQMSSLTENEFSNLISAVNKIEGSSTDPSMRYASTETEPTAEGEQKEESPYASIISQITAPLRSGGFTKEAGVKALGDILKTATGGIAQMTGKKV